MNLNSDRNVETRITGQHKLDFTLKRQEFYDQINHRLVEYKRTNDDILTELVESLEEYEAKSTSTGMDLTFFPTIKDHPRLTLDLEKFDKIDEILNSVENASLYSIELINFTDNYRKVVDNIIQKKWAQVKITEKEYTYQLSGNPSNSTFLSPKCPIVLELYLIRELSIDSNNTTMISKLKNEVSINITGASKKLIINSPALKYTKRCNIVNFEGAIDIRGFERVNIVKSKISYFHIEVREVNIRDCVLFNKRYYIKDSYKIRIKGCEPIEEKLNPMLKIENAKGEISISKTVLSLALTDSKIRFFASEASNYNYLQINNTSFDQSFRLAGGVSNYVHIDKSDLSLCYSVFSNIVITKHFSLFKTEVSSQFKFDDSVKVNTNIEAGIGFYNDIRKKFEDLNNDILAAKFYKLEYETRYNLLKKSRKNSIEYYSFLFAKGLNNYGTSISKPVVWLLLTFPIFFSIYYIFLIFSPFSFENLGLEMIKYSSSRKIPDAAIYVNGFPDFAKALYLTLIGALGPIGLLGDLEKNFSMGLILKIVFSIHRIVSTVLIVTIYKYFQRMFKQ